MNDIPVNQPVDKPCPEDIVSVRFVLPGSIVKQSEQQIEICSCAGSVICVPQSMLKSVERRPVHSQTADQAEYVALETSLSRDCARLLRSLVAEVSRLTHEVVELQEQAKGGS